MGVPKSGFFECAFGPLSSHPLHLQALSLAYPFSPLHFPLYTPFLDSRKLWFRYPYDLGTFWCPAEKAIFLAKGMRSETWMQLLLIIGSLPFGVELLCFELFWGRFLLAMGAVCLQSVVSRGFCAYAWSLCLGRWKARKLLTHISSAALRPPFVPGTYWVSTVYFEFGGCFYWVGCLPS